MSSYRHGRAAILPTGVTLLAAVVGLCTAALLNVGCQPTKEKQSLRIGFIGSMSGKYATMGITARDGTIFGIEELNQGGGVCGRQVELVVKDDGGNPEKALEQAIALHDMGIRYIIGPLTSASGAAILPWINEKGILTISPTTTSQTMADREDLFIKFSPNADQYGEMIGKDLIEAGTRKLLVIDDTGNPVFCKSFISGIEKALQDTDGKDTVRLSFDSSNQPSFRELASRGLALEAEAVVFCSSSIDTAVLSQHLKLGDPGLDLYSAEWAVSANLLENGGEFVEGLSFYSVMNHSDDSETFNVFRDRYRQRFGIVPNLAAMNYYETVNVLSEALSQDCSVTEPSALLETIVTTGMFQGVQRGFHFDKEGDAVVPLMKHLIKEGKFVRIDQE